MSVESVEMTFIEVEYIVLGTATERQVPPTQERALPPTPLKALPTLAQLAAQPELAANLPRDAACRLYLQAQGVMLACALALLSEPTKDAAVSDGHDQLIDSREAARLLHRSVSWIQQGAKRPPLKFCTVRTLGRGLLFSRKKIDTLIARELGQNPEDKMLGLRGVNSGRRPRRKGTAGPPSTPESGGESGGGEHQP